MSRIAMFTTILTCLMVTAARGEPQEAPTKKAVERAATLMENSNAFQLRLLYHGPQGKPFYNLTLSVRLVPQLASDPFHPLVQISEEQAKKIIAHLAKDGFLDEATDPKTEKKAAPTTAGYSLTVNEEDLVWKAELGWDLAMLRRLDGLQTVLNDRAAEVTKMLIARLAGYSREWEKEARE